VIQPVRTTGVVPQAMKRKQALPEGVWVILVLEKPDRILQDSASHDK
jgi:hypothetical protein